MFRDQWDRVSTAVPGPQKSESHKKEKTKITEKRENHRQALNVMQLTTKANSNLLLKDIYYQKLKCW